jgi:hypothetical protein
MLSGKLPFQSEIPENVFKNTTLGKFNIED